MEPREEVEPSASRGPNRLTTLWVSRNFDDSDMRSYAEIFGGFCGLLHFFQSRFSSILDGLLPVNKRTVFF